MIEPDYGNEVRVAGSGDALMFMYTNDNMGVPTVEEVRSMSCSKPM